MFDLRRREFITLLGGAAAWPLTARAQQSERVRRIGVLMNRAANDREGQARVAAFQQALQQLGWRGGRDVRRHPLGRGRCGARAPIRGRFDRARAACDPSQWHAERNGEGWTSLRTRAH